MTLTGLAGNSLFSSAESVDVFQETMLNPLTDFDATGARRCSRLLQPISGCDTSDCLSVTGVQAITGKFLVYARASRNKVRDT